MRSWFASLILRAAALPTVLVVGAGVLAGSIQTTETAEGILFTEDGARVLFYQRAPKSFNGAATRNHYLHPLWDLQGHVLTEDAPEDHVHQRGIYWAWHQTRVGDVRLGDAWECRDFVWDVLEARVEDVAPSAKRLVARVHWQSTAWVDREGQPRPAVQETTRVTVHPRDQGRRNIDFDIQLLALAEQVTIGGSEDVKGYGGFSFRVRCPEDLSFLSSPGRVNPRNEAVVAGPWMDCVGSFSEGGRSGLLVLVHPENPHPVNRWILRGSRSMQNAVYPGREPTAISLLEPTRLRYRIVLHQDEMTGDEAERRYRDYAVTAP